MCPCAQTERAHVSRKGSVSPRDSIGSTPVPSRTSAQAPKQSPATPLLEPVEAFDDVAERCGAPKSISRRFLRCAIWSSCSGIVAAMPRSRRKRQRRSAPHRDHPVTAPLDADLAWVSDPSRGSCMTQRPSAARPASVIRPASSSSAAIRRLRSDVVPRVRRGVKRWR